MNHKSNEKKDLRRFLKYLGNSGYEQTFVYLMHAQIQLRVRRYLLTETVNTLRRKMVIPIATKEEDKSRKILETHALQFDLIAKIFMLIEDLFYFVDFLSTNPKKLPSDMVKKQPIKKEVLHEWKKMKIRKIIRIFKFPNLSNSKMSKEEKSFIKIILTKQAKLAQSKLSRVGRFWLNFLDVYNAYKHGLTAILGFYGILEEKRILSMFLVRRKCTVRKKEFAHTIYLSAQTQ